MTQSRTSAAGTTAVAIQSTHVLARLAALTTMSMSDLKQQWRLLFETEAPSFSRTYLHSRLAYRIQELAHGGLKPETAVRLEVLGKRLDGGNPILRRLRADDRPIAGTRLVREYQGVEHVATVLSGGFEYEGRPYQSLSAIARHITNTRWNGWVFFGLRNNRSGA